MKKTTLNKIFGASSLLLVASFAFAEGNKGADFDKLDKNKDGVLSAAEASKSSELSNQWTNIDIDGSGTIDRAEFSAFETGEMSDQQRDGSAPQTDKQMQKDQNQKNQKQQDRY